MKTHEKLDKLSSVLFVIGFCFGQLKYLPFFLFSLITNSLSLLFNCCGYLVLMVASHFYPDQDAATEAWYGFQQFKEQIKTAAAIGLTAMICGFVALAVPVMIIPSFWLYALHSTLRCVAEYHKKCNPPVNDEHFSSTRQARNFQYSLFTSALNIFAAIAATLAFFIPAIAFPTLVTAGFVCSLMVIWATYCWLDSTFGTHLPDIPLRMSSNKRMNIQLSASPGYTPANELAIREEQSHTFLLLQTHQPSLTEQSGTRSQSMPEFEGSSYHLR